MITADTVPIWLHHPVFARRRKRSSIPDPDIAPHKITGGERAFLYEVHKTKYKCFWILFAKCCVLILKYIFLVFFKFLLNFEYFITKHWQNFIFPINFMILIQKWSFSVLCIYKENICVHLFLATPHLQDLWDKSPLLYHWAIISFYFKWVENYLFTFGMDGKGCLLRAICETHETPLLGYGLIGEFLEVFLS